MSTSQVVHPGEERILPTLNSDGSRRWLRPRLSKGRFLTARRIVAYVLIAIFTLLPHIRIGGKPAILLDIVHREFTLFGRTFLPTDTVLLALLLIGTIVTIFLVTAVFGRVWCGYGCPQTVYLEFVYRPLERLFDGPPGRGGAPGRKKSGPRTVAKYVCYLLVSMFLAHTFLAYFVGVDALRQWMQRSPVEHPTSFIVMAATTALMLFDFSYFREQTCIVACPYGRLQSVLVDRDSLIVSYDPVRGEPRGKGRGHGPRAQGAEGTENATATLEAEKGGEERRGDCVDCGLCVETCPTGIDIREGLKMECVGCAQCIDACDAVMDKIGRPRGLIRYSSQARIAREPGRIARPRVFIYPVVLLAVAALFVTLLSTKADTDITLLRGFGVPFVEMPGGEISNSARLKIRNRRDAPAAYRIEAVGEPSARLIIDEDPVVVPAGGSVTKGVLMVVPASVFVGGKHDIRLRVSDASGFSLDLTCRLLGPAGSGGGGAGTSVPGKEAPGGER